MDETSEQPTKRCVTSKHMVHSQDKKSFPVPQKKKRLLRDKTVLRVLSVVLLHLIYLVAIATLFGISRANDGLWNVQHRDHGNGRDRVNQNLTFLWTTVPVLFFSILALCVKSCYDTSSDIARYRQRHEDGSASGGAPSQSNSKGWSVSMIWHAVSQRQYLSLCTSTSSLLLLLAAVPLSARLFDTQLRQTTEPLATVAQMTSWNESKIIRLTNFTGPLALLSAPEVYNTTGTIAPWTSSIHSFPAYISTTENWPERSTVRIPKVLARAGYFEDATFLNQSEYTIERVQQSSDPGSEANVQSFRLSGKKERCSFTHGFNASRSSGVVLEIGVAHCPHANGDNSTTPDLVPDEWTDLDGYTLIFMLLISPDANDPPLEVPKSILVAGSPWIKAVEGSVEISVQGRSLSPTFTDFNRWFEAIRPFSVPSAQGLLRTQIPSARKLENIETEAFGTSILRGFDSVQLESPEIWVDFDPYNRTDSQRRLLEGIKRAYSQAFAAAASLYGYEATEQILDDPDLDTTITRDVERLFVVTGVAAFLIAFLSLSLIVAFCVLAATMRMKQDTPQSRNQAGDIIRGSQTPENIITAAHRGEHPSKAA
ncbi:hypothetical protein CC79DRAFT_1318100 [Sarocladium strictum]